MSAFSDVRLVMRPSGVVARMEGGARRLTAAEADIALDSRGSADLDVSARPLLLSWQCRIAQSGLLDSSAINEAVQSISSPSDAFSLGTPCGLNLTD